MTLSEGSLRPQLVRNIAGLFRCQSCPRVFDKRGEYNRHQRTHTRPFRCEECHKCPGLKSNLVRHKNRHHNGRHVKFHCRSYNCKYSALHNDRLWRHMWSFHVRDDGASGLEASWIPKLFQESLEEQKKEEQSCLLLSALAQENSLQVGLLLASGADPNRRTTEGATALHIAIAKGNDQLICALLKAEAEVNAQDGRGFTALQAASNCRERDVMKIETRFWSRSITVGGYEKRDQAGLTKYRVLLQLLLKYAAEQSLSNEWAASILEWAIEEGDGELINAILVTMADLDPEGSSKEAALWIAAEMGFPDATRILLQKATCLKRDKTLNGIEK